MTRRYRKVGLGVCGAFALVSSMPGTTPRQTELRGDELTALTVATKHFQDHKYSNSGLSHYTITVFRQRAAFEVDFVPDDPPNPPPSYAGTGGRTIYGSGVSYFLSLHPVNIIRVEFSR